MDIKYYDSNNELKTRKYSSLVEEWILHDHTKANFEQAYKKMNRLTLIMNAPYYLNSFFEEQYSIKFPNEDDENYQEELYSGALAANTMEALILKWKRENYSVKDGCLIFIPILLSPFAYFLFF